MKKGEIDLMEERVESHYSWPGDYGFDLRQLDSYAPILGMRFPKEHPFIFHRMEGSLAEFQVHFLRGFFKIKKIGSDERMCAQRLQQRCVKRVENSVLF